MASFIVYNIQLLPANTRNTKEVGVEGYKRLFEKLHQRTVQAFKNKKLTDMSFHLGADTYFAPRSTICDAVIAYGEWIKYHKSDTVEDLYSNATIFQAAKGTFPVANRVSFDYVFDYESHRMAISESGGRLPKPSVCNEALEEIFSKFALEVFPRHVLKINLVSDPTELESVLNNAEGFKAVSTTLTFPNGHRLGKQLQELKNKNVHHLKVEASTESKDSAMPSLPDFLREMVEASVDYGTTTLSYILEAGGRLHRYTSSKYPLKIRFRKKNNEQPAGLRLRVLQALRQLGGATQGEGEDV
ncbi:hypothetical protein O999_18720 [Pseudomonas putida LF54]|uniref:DUF4747 family protein n=1 Tax=Pseudomonas putida TaxID=303 RepID=UPI0003AE8F24|nr:DUF4747 family protein [Pseudomonas putida]ERL02483.1 hypothetical protein O999_18720 [Pseudomonas putida LF54]